MSKPDYSIRDPKGWMGDPRRGSAMGRPLVRGHDASHDGRIFIRRVAINAGGYDCNGTYFGHSPNSERLYWVATLDNLIDYVEWAPDRSVVEEAVRKAWPLAKVMSTGFSRRRRPVLVAA